MSSTHVIQRMTIPCVMDRKKVSSGEYVTANPLVCLTAYHTHMARLLDPHIDILLVGDSLGMVLYGMENTLEVTLEMMILHGRAVMRGSKRACVVVDMPFGTYEETPQIAFKNASRILKETCCQAVKIEGGTYMAETIFYLQERGIPVMAHIGLMPQTINMMGGFKRQGMNENQWKKLKDDASAVVAAGAFSVVLEGMVAPLADEITKAIPIPTIGIGASSHCDGQILVTEDMLGLSMEVPRFVKKFSRLGNQISDAVEQYTREVRCRDFPEDKHTYPMKK